MYSRYNLDRTKLYIKKCIRIGDYRKSIDPSNKKPFANNLHNLAKLLEEHNPYRYPFHLTYKRLLRVEAQGFVKIDNQLVVDLQEIINVSRRELFVKKVL